MASILFLHASQVGPSLRLYRKQMFLASLYKDNKDWFEGGTRDSSFVFFIGRKTDNIG